MSNQAKLRVATMDIKRAPISQCVEALHLLKRLVSAGIVKSELLKHAPREAELNDRVEPDDDYHYVLVAFSKKYRDLLFEVTIYDEAEYRDIIVERRYYVGGMFGKAKITQTVPTLSETCLTSTSTTESYDDLMHSLHSAEEGKRSTEKLQKLAAQARAKPKHRNGLAIAPARPWNRELDGAPNVLRVTMPADEAILRGAITDVLLRVPPEYDFKTEYLCGLLD